MYNHCIVILLFSLVTACGQADEKFASYVIGYSTPANNDISIEKIVIDEQKRLPGGGLACCWEELTASVALYERPLPRHIALTWRDESEQTRYHADVVLPNISKQAKTMPPYTWKLDGKQNKRIFILIGMAEKGKVVIWLTNAPHNKNLTGRVLHTIVETQAIGTPIIKQNEKN